jgi:hypothetical protein
MKGESNRPITQYAGSKHIFPACGHGGILPALGRSNAFAIWRVNETLSQGGYWLCRYDVYKNIEKSHRGEGSSGLLGRMSRLRSTSKARARSQKYKPILDSPEQMLQIWENQRGKCAACGGKLKLLEATADHNHKTGKFRGFLHRFCNVAEGYLFKLSMKERKNFFNWINMVRK